MNKQAAYVQVLSEFYPDLSISSAHLHNQGGQYNDVLILNHEIVVRFPRYAEGISQLQKEVRLLRCLQGLTSLPVPDPIYASPEQEPLGRFFMGYRMLPGEPLWRTTWQGIADQAALQRLAGQLAGFLHELHHLPVETVGADLPIRDSREEAAHLYAQVRRHLYPLMRPDARDRVTAHFVTYLENPTLHRYPPAIQHGDFGSGNILYRPESCTISGILDWGFAAVGDPALDIAAVSTYGQSFLERFDDMYPGIESMLERASFYRGTYALEEALHGFTHGDRDAFEAGMADYV